MQDQTTIESSRAGGMPLKRSADGAPKETMTSSSSSPSPVVSAFAYFRSELDEHHDRRERIIKASRDITAQSKKIIFSLQRHRLLGRPLSAAIASDVAARKAEIQRLLASLVPDLAPSTAAATDSSASSLSTSAPAPQASSLRQQRYLRQVSPGLQELVEAAVFERYLLTQKLLSLEEARAALLPEPLRPLLAEADYLLGVYDATGEIMRFAITGMATGGAVPAGVDGGGSGEGGEGGVGGEGGGEGGATGRGGAPGRNVLTDLRELRAALEGLDVRAAGGSFAKECDRKGEVMRQSVNKVEAAVYGLIVRGKERPKGWLPEAKTADAPREVEGY